MHRNLRIVAAALVGAGAAALCAAALPGGAGGQGTATTVTLQVAPRGLGVVSANPPGLDSDNQPASDCARNFAQRSCEWRYARGTTVTLTARPDSATGRSLAGWSIPGCVGTGTCRVVLDADRTSVVALFTPLRIAVRLSNAQAGAVSIDPPGAECRGQLHDPTPNLCREFPARTRVTLTARVSPSHTFRAWSSGCVPVGPSSCAITILDEATWVGASFDGDDLPVLPTTIRVQFRLRKEGDGSGRLAGTKLDCGSECGAQFDYGTSLALTAVPDRGSVIEGWNGVCAATAMRCTVPVGPITAIAARFEHALTAQIVAVRVRRSGRARTLVIGLAVNRTATVRASLVRRRVAVRRNYRVARGRSVLRLRVPRRLVGGRYRLHVTLAAGGRTLTLPGRVVRLPRRR